MADTIATVSLTFGQRVAACSLLAADINKAGNGLTAETWETKAPKQGVGISVLENGEKVAIVTVNGKGYLNIRSYLEGIAPATLAKLETFGFSPGKFTEPVKNYQGISRFDSSRLAKS